jgi:hypothetical protein
MDKEIDNTEKKEEAQVDSKKNIKIKKFKELDGKFLLVNVGTIEEPATDEQIDSVKDNLVDLFEKNNINCLTFVTHHAVKISIIDNNTDNGV